MIGVDQTVIGRVRLAEHRETLGVLLPGKLAAVDDGAAERGAVPAHELGQRMHHDVGAVFDRPQQDRRGDRVVDDQRHAVFVGHARQRFDVADISRRIADTFAKDRPRLVVDQLLDILGTIRFREADRDSLAWQNVSEQCVGGAVELRNRDDVACPAPSRSAPRS